MIQSPPTPSRLPFRAPDVPTLIIVGVLIVVGLVAMGFARQAIEPLDGLLTRRACAAIGDEVARPVRDVEASNRFALTNRSQGWCEFGPVDPERAAELEDKLAPGQEPDLSEGAARLALADAEIDVQVPLPELVLDGLYRAGKWMGLLLQFGAASIAVRIVADPLFEYFVRNRRSAQRS